MGKIAIIDYKAGNAPSVLSAVMRLGHDSFLAKKASELECASHIILPGVGTAAATMESLEEMGFVEALERLVLRDGRFFLGVCVGLQILFENSEEGSSLQDGMQKCLGWLGGDVKRFDDTKVKVPQIGWNEVRFVKKTAITSAPPSDYFYFVNSYRAVPSDKSVTWAEADYDGGFCAAVNKDNIYAAQFHLEKSGESGLRLLDGFINL